MTKHHRERLDQRVKLAVTGLTSTRVDRDAAATMPGDDLVDALTEEQRAIGELDTQLGIARPYSGVSKPSQSGINKKDWQEGDETKAELDY